MSSPISFSGLVSGLDTKSIISAQLQAYQAPVKLLQAQQTTEQNKLQAFQDLSTKVQALQTAASTLSLASTVGAKQVTFSGPTGTFATATATADATNQSFQLQIDQLASATTLISSASIGTPVAGADTAVGNTKTGTPITVGSFSINGQIVNITAADTFDAVAAKIQTALQTATGSALPTATLGADNKMHLNLNGAGGTIQVGSAGDSSNFLTVTNLAGQPAAAALDSAGPIGVTNPAASLGTVLNTGTAIAAGDVVVGNAKLSTAITAGTFSINGSAVTLNAGDTFATVLANINAATGGSVTGSIVGNKIQLTSAAAITIGGGGDTSNFLAGTFLSGQGGGTTVTSSALVGTNGSLAINGTTITFNSSTDTLNSFLAKLNTSTAGVSAVYNSATDAVTLTSAKTGNLDVTAVDATGTLLHALNLDTAGAHHLGNSAKYEVNGGAAQYSLNNTVNNLQPNVNVTFSAPTPSALTVSVSQNATVGTQAVQNFVTAYNSVLDTISKDTAYDTTTKTAGIFLGDSTVENLSEQLDQGLFISNGANLGLTPGFQTVSSIGLSTGPIGSSPGTTTDLTFDSSTFQNAITSNPAAVTNLVTTLFGGLNKLAMNIVQPSGLLDSAIQSENSQIQDFQTQINTQNDFIAQEQTILTNEYTALETQLAQIQSQAAIGASALSSFATQQSTQAASSQSTTSQLLGTSSTGSSTGA